MPALTLHYHPLSSYCWKVLIALEELGVDIELRRVNPGDAIERAEFLRLWPTGKIPLLFDQGRPIPESSIIIEHLQRHHAAPGRGLIPAREDESLDVRLWDRLFDCYVMTPMQAFTADLLRAPQDRDPLNLSMARDALLSAYRMIDMRMQGRAWAAGEDFSLADCAAAPALFYAVAYVAVPAEHVQLSAYLSRLFARSSVARTIDQARPYFKHFPGRAGLAAQYHAEQ